MAELIFNGEHHEYTLDGVIIPSVTYILRFMTREVYKDVSQSVLDNAADRGQRIHAATQALDAAGAVQIDGDIEPYVQAYAAFLRKYKPRWDTVEKAVYHPAALYAGTIDRAGTINDERWIIDIKSTASLQKPLVAAQDSGYAMAEEAHGRAVDHIAALHLRKDGTYRLVESDRRDDVFAACLLLHRSLEKKRRKS